MEPWAGVVSAVAVGLAAGLLVFSAGTRVLGRDYRPIISPPVSAASEGISADAATLNRSSNARCYLI
jgi:hypothetical protein